MAIVKPVDPDDPGGGRRHRRVEEAAGRGRHPHLPAATRTRAPPTDPGFDRILKAAVQHDLPVNFLCWGKLDQGTQLIDRHPNARFIIDHLGILQPRVPPAPAQPWADLPKVLELAKRPNVVIKVERRLHAGEASPIPSRTSGTRWQRVFDAWGFERCLWGTDWTRAFAVVNYEQAVKPFLEDQAPERFRASHADGRRLRQGLRLVAEEGS